MAGSADILATSRLDPIMMAMAEVCLVLRFVILLCCVTVLCDCVLVSAVVWSYFECVFACDVEVSLGEDLVDACGRRMFL